VRKVFASLDPELPVRQRTLQSTVDRALASARFQARLLGGFSVVALLLAVVGVYSVLSYGVVQRRQEIGIRLALGASRLEIQRLIFGDGMKIVLAGIVCGGLLSLAVATVLRSQLFQIGTVDPAAYLAVTIVLAGIAALACFFPAQRASKLEPVSILRAE
jgi:putative ABC transport system permease protein